MVRAPLVGVVPIVEMTGDYEQMLPRLISCFCDYAVAALMKDLPIYEALLERDLLHGSTPRSAGRQTNANESSAGRHHPFFYHR